MGGRDIPGDAAARLNFPTAEVVALQFCPDREPQRIPEPNMVLNETGQDAVVRDNRIDGEDALSGVAIFSEPIRQSPAHIVAAGGGEPVVEVDIERLQLVVEAGIVAVRAIV